MDTDIKYQNAVGRLLSGFKVNEENGCWEWQRSLTTSGYGQFIYNGKPVGAHVFSYKYFKEDYVKGLDVCHKCDNPKCINPKHLFMGTRKQNINDAQSKGRFKTGMPHPSYVHYIHGCRCDDCKRCYTAYYRENKEKKLAANRKIWAKRALTGYKRRQYIPKSNNTMRTI